MTVDRNHFHRGYLLLEQLSPNTQLTPLTYTNRRLSSQHRACIPRTIALTLRYLGAYQSLDNVHSISNKL